MSPGEIAQFYEQRGFHVIRTSSCWWFNEYRQRRVYTSFPSHSLLRPGEDELNSLFSQAPGCLAARFISPCEGRGIKTAMWVRRGPYDLSSLRSKARNQTRRGLDQCTIRTMSWNELTELGWLAHRDTQNRHGYADAGSLGVDGQLSECPAFQAWGAFVGEVLAAYLVTLCVDDCLEFLINRSANDYLGFYPNNALVYHVTNLALSGEGIRKVSYGWGGLIANPGLDHFKLNMGFVGEPACQRVVFRPSIRWLLQPPMCRMIGLLISRASQQSGFQKLASLIRAAC